jgi:hypothetical protein
MLNRIHWLSRKSFALFVISAVVFGLIASMDQGLATLASPPSSCVLLVDDDQDNPDVRSYYTSTLHELDIIYDTWDLATQGDPSAGDLMGYQIVIWFTGYPRSDTFTAANEAAVASYLDAEGRFWLVSEDYLYDRGLTPFGQDRLSISSYTNDVNRTDPEGVLYSPGSGLGPYNLTPPDGWPGELYTDNVIKRIG